MGADARLALSQQLMKLGESTEGFILPVCLVWNMFTFFCSKIIKINQEKIKHSLYLGAYEIQAFSLRLTFSQPAIISL